MSNYIKDRDALKDDFKESMNEMTYIALRIYFFHLTIEGFPTGIIWNDEECKKAMYEPNTNLNNVMLLNDLLRDLKFRFEEINQKLENYGLPEPQGVQTELERYRLLFNKVMKFIFIKYIITKVIH